MRAAVHDSVGRALDLARTLPAKQGQELIELSRSEMKDYFRPNFFTNTPDILPEILQQGGRPAFKFRLVLAATLSPSYGIYSGYELCENRALPGKEEYLDSEKYEITVWDWDRPGHIVDYVTLINRIRQENPALHELENLEFYESSNDQVVFFGKSTFDKKNSVLVMPVHGSTSRYSATFQRTSSMPG